MCVCVGVCGCVCVVCVVWVAHISIVKTKKLRFFRIFFIICPNPQTRKPANPQTRKPAQEESSLICGLVIPTLFFFFLFCTWSSFL